MKILPSEFAVEMASEFGRVLRSPSGEGLPSDTSEADIALSWSRIVDGEWQLAGLAESAGGAGLDLLDLTLIAEAWGRHMLPLPYMPTLLLWRWRGSVDEDAKDAQLTYAIGQSASALSPFGLMPAVKIVRVAQGPHGDDVAISESWAAEASSKSSSIGSWSSTLPISRVSITTNGIPASGTKEIAVLGAAESIGVAQRAFELSRLYAMQRKQFGRAIVEFQAVQHHLANSFRDLEIARSAVLGAVNEADWACLVSQAWVMTRHVAERCVQLHGGFGFTEESGIHMFLRHLWAIAELLRKFDVEVWE